MDMTLRAAFLGSGSGKPAEPKSTMYDLAGLLGVPVPPPKVTHGS